jgi:hypothetical protein
MSAQADSSNSLRAAGLWRRFLARGIDWVVAGSASAVLLWPMAWDGARGLLTNDATNLAGAMAFGRGSGLRASAEGVLTDGIAQARQILILTLLGQVLLVAVYEWVLTAAIGTTAGKALLGLGVRIRSMDGHPTAVRERVARLGVRSLLAVLPGGLALSAALVAASGSLAAVAIAVPALGWFAVDIVFGASGRRCLHDRLSHTWVLPLRASRARPTAVPGPRPDPLVAAVDGHDGAATRPTVPVPEAAAPQIPAPVAPQVWAHGTPAVSSGAPTPVRGARERGGEAIKKLRGSATAHRASAFGQNALDRVKDSSIGDRAGTAGRGAFRALRGKG